MPDNPRVTARNDARELLGGRTFLATVDATSGGLVRIRRQGPGPADGQYYPAAAGLAAAVSPGDTVLCLVAGGQVIVLAEIVTA